MNLPKSSALQRLVFCLFAFSILTLVYGCADSTPPIVDVSSKLPKWSPEESELGKLGPAETLLEISIRAPAGYEKQERDGPNGAKMVGWVGERREDGTAPNVQLMIAPIPEGQRVPTVAGALDKMIDGVRRDRDGWSQSDSEIGLINGLEFARMEWTGTLSGSTHNLKGYMYTGIHDGVLYQLATQDLIANDETDLKTGHSSILTFEKLNRE